MNENRENGSTKLWQFYYSSVSAKELDIWVKDYQELRPQRAATLANFHQFLLVLKSAHY